MNLYQFTPSNRSTTQPSDIDGITLVSSAGRQGLQIAKGVKLGTLFVVKVEEESATKKWMIETNTSCNATNENVVEDCSEFIEFI